jgi:hypothetical protein
MTLYVKPVGGEEYHWCKNCSNYPEYIGGTTTTRPEGYLCDQCKAKERNGNCH